MNPKSRTATKNNRQGYKSCPYASDCCPHGPCPAHLHIFLNSLDLVIVASMVVRCLSFHQRIGRGFDIDTQPLHRSHPSFCSCYFPWHLWLHLRSRLMFRKQQSGDVAYSSNWAIPAAVPWHSKAFFHRHSAINHAYSHHTSASSTEIWVTSGAPG